MHHGRGLRHLCGIPELRDDGEWPPVTIRRLDAQELLRLTALFDYNDVGQMVEACAQDIRNGDIDIFILEEDGVLIGELHARYTHEDARFAVRGRRAYLFAFRVREDRQNQGYGTRLLRTVLSALMAEGYTEFTVGVEDDNLRARHMYQAAGFDAWLLRKHETYQGDTYEYDLYLKKA